MNQPRISTEYEVWHATSGNLIAFFDSAAAALSELRSWVDQAGEVVLADLYIVLEPYSPDFGDEESLELDADDWFGPGNAIVTTLEALRKAETPVSAWTS